MFGFVLRRLALVIPTFLGITLLAFSLIHLIPGDPVQVMAGERRLDPEFYKEVMHKLGLDRPLWEQYLAYLWKALHLDLGESFVTHEAVWSEFGKLFPATLELSLCALLFATVFGLLAGVLAAIKRGSILDHGVMVLSLTGFSMPKPKNCPACNAENSFTSIGPGVERIEVEVREFFPKARMSM